MYISKVLCIKYQYCTVAYTLDRYLTSSYSCRQMISPVHHYKIILICCQILNGSYSSMNRFPTLISVHFTKKVLLVWFALIFITWYPHWQISRWHLLLKHTLIYPWKTIMNCSSLCIGIVQMCLWGECIVKIWVKTSIKNITYTVM